MRTPFNAILIVVLALAGCGGEDVHPEPPVRAIQWIRVGPSEGADVRRLSGVLEPVQDSRLAFEIGGTVSRVAVSLGDHVPASQVLAELDPKPFTLVVREAEAAYSRARAVQQEALRSFERTTVLFEAGNTSTAELDRARASRRSANSDVRAAAARLDLVRRDLDKSVLRAPFAGVISAKRVDPFEEVAPGQRLFEIDGERAGLRVRLRVPEALIGRVELGQPVQVRVSSQGNTVTNARISRIGARALAGDAYEVKADLEDTSAALRSGMTAEVELRLAGSGSEQHAFLTVPKSALSAGADDTQFVFVYDAAASTVEKRRVVADRIHGQQIEVRSGLEAGDVVATAGVAFLRDQQKVTLLGADLAAVGAGGNSR